MITFKNKVLRRRIFNVKGTIRYRRLQRTKLERGQSENQSIIPWFKHGSVGECVIIVL